MQMKFLNVSVLFQFQGLDTQNEDPPLPARHDHRPEPGDIHLIPGINFSPPSRFHFAVDFYRFLLQKVLGLPAAVDHIQAF
jgi:hypothetical protein